MIRPVIPIVTALCWLAVAYKLRDLCRNPRSGALRSLCLTLVALAASLTAQLTAAAIDRYSAIPNLGRVLSNSTALIAACGAQVFLVHITHDPAAARPVARRRYRTLAICLVLIAVLFAATPPDPNSSAASARHFQTIYSSPYIWIYLGYLATTLAGITRLSWHYAALSPSLSLRLGLRTTAVAGGLGLIYALLRGLFLTAHLLGTSLPAWEAATAGPLYLLTASLMLLGGTLPAWGSALGAGRDLVRGHRSLRRLQPLWHALRAAFPDITLLPPSNRFADMLDPRDVNLRLYRRIVEIRDGQLALRPYVTPELAQTAQRHARDARLTGPLRDAAIEAATIAAGLAAKADGEAGTAVAGPVPEPGMPVPGTPTDRAAETAWLEAVAYAYTHSPVVPAVLTERQAARQ